jgi:hypothetical protein
VDDKVVGSIGCFGDEQREVWYWYDRAVWGGASAPRRSPPSSTTSPSGPCSPTS